MIFITHLVIIDKYSLSICLLLKTVLGIRDTEPDKALTI